ncbi:hypothetical protein BDZ45DRAFT_681624 [Acephala macrosclerotiorum]|nr:hypothetical protein BDZ45DRAFT_681624 [Acephala macrosclerotiorum]
MPSPQVSKVIASLEKEQNQAFSSCYVPAEKQLKSWIILRDTNPESIRQNAFKKRANRWSQILFNYSKELFTLCALAIPWSTLGDVRTKDDVLEIIEWWGIVQHPLCLTEIYENGLSRLNRCEFPDRSSKRARTSPASNPPESNDPIYFTPSSGIDPENAAHTNGINTPELIDSRLPQTNVTVFRNATNIEEIQSGQQQADLYQAKNPHDPATATLGIKLQILRV